MLDMEYSYAWRGFARTPGRASQQAGAAPGSASVTTPSRSTRRSGFLNLTHYNAFTRSDGAIFQVGDVVQVWDGTEFAPAQVWLDPYKSLGVQSAQSTRREEEEQRRHASSAASTSTSTSTGAATRRPAAAGTAAVRAKRAGKHHAALVQREQEQVELIDDGLDDSVKFGIVIDLFEDEEENMRAAIHWLARPRLLCLLFGNAGAREEGLDESHPKELIYAFDPAEDSRLSKTAKSSRAEDIHDVSYILCRIRVKTHERFTAKGNRDGQRSAFNEDQEDDEPTFFVRKAMNTKAEQGEGWFYDVTWQDIYDRALTSGNWELSLGVAAGEQDTPQRGRKAGGPSKATSARAVRGPAAKRGAPGSALREKVIKRVVQDIEKDLPKLPSVRAASASTSRRSSRASSVDTEMLEEESVLDEDDELEETSEEDEEDGEDVYDAGRHSDEENVSEDEEADMDLGEPSSDEADYKEEEEDVNVFGSRTASGRKRKVAGKGKVSPTKRSRGSGTGAVVLRPSAATVRKAAARAARQAQRLAERQARRLKPRLPFAQQRQLGRRDDAMTPFERARAVLHVGCTPDYLPCRDEEYAEIEAYLEDAIDEGVGSCIYIAGVPGTGKTATVRSVISSLQQRANDSEIKKFRFLEVNGMKITDPAQSFSILWEFISGNRTSPKVALNNLETHFKTPDPGRDTCVILVDELDQLVTKRQEVIYNFFNWPNQAHSRLIVLAIANTMDLPERELSNKITSRLGSNRINFTPYDKNQLIEILRTRMDGFGDTVFAKDAIGLVAGKVAGVTGDARRALDICRRAVEKVEQENTARSLAAAASATQTESTQPHKDRLVTAADIVVVHREMTSSGLMLFVKRAGLHQRIMLLALSRAIRKVGVADEAEFGDVIRWHLDFCRQTALSPLPTHTQLFSILQSLADMKLVTTEGARLDRFQRVQANVRDDELELVLRKEGRFMHYLR